MGVKLWINKGRIYLSLCYSKKQWRESTGLTVSSDKATNKEIMKMAEVMRAKRELQMAAERHGVAYEINKETLLEYAARYIDEIGQSKTYGKALPYLKKHGAENILVANVTPSWYEDFQNRMNKETLAPATKEKYCGVLRQALKKAVRDGILTKDPAMGIKRISVPEVERDFLTAEELQKMINTEFFLPRMEKEKQLDIRNAFIFGCLTGFRISDIKKLQWKMLDTTEMRISVYTTKTSKAAYIPMRKEILSLLDFEKPHDPDDLVFPGLDTKDKREIKYSRYLQPWADKAGVNKHVHFHVSRHTDATLLLESGAELYTVQKILGHTKIQTTAIYAKVSDKLKKEAVENLPDFDL